jgi:hypothetical protein
MPQSLPPWPYNLPQAQFVPNRALSLSYLPIYATFRPTAKRDRQKNLLPCYTPFSLLPPMSYNGTAALLKLFKAMPS